LALPFHVLRSFSVAIWLRVLQGTVTRRLQARHGVDYVMICTMPLMYAIDDLYYGRRGDELWAVLLCAPATACGINFQHQEAIAVNSLVVTTAIYGPKTTQRKCQTYLAIWQNERICKSQKTCESLKTNWPVISPHSHTRRAWTRIVNS